MTASLIHKHHPKPLPPRDTDPETGWVRFDVFDIDLSNPYGMDVYHCHRCGYEPLRYVHLLRHPQTRKITIVGACCAKHLCEDYDATQEEAPFRSLWDRRERFADSPRWTETHQGNERYRTAHFVAVVYPCKKHPHRFAACIIRRGPGERPIYIPPEPTARQVKLATFTQLLELGLLGGHPP